MATTDPSSRRLGSRKTLNCMLFVIFIFCNGMWIFTTVASKSSSDQKTADGQAFTYNPIRGICSDSQPHDLRKEDPEPVPIQLGEGCYQDRWILSWRSSELIVQFEDPKPGDYISILCTGHSQPLKIFTPDSNMQELARLLHEECETPPKVDAYGRTIDLRGISPDFATQGRGKFVIWTQTTQAPPRPPSLLDQ